MAGTRDPETDKIVDRLLQAIISYWLICYRSPTLRELMDLESISSTSVVTYYLDRLEKDGKIERCHKKGARGIVPIGLKITFVEEE